MHKKSYVSTQQANKQADRQIVPYLNEASSYKTEPLLICNEAWSTGRLRIWMRLYVIDDNVALERMDE